MKNLIARSVFRNLTRNLASRFTPLALAVLLLFAGTLNAQYVPRIVKVTVPFDFNVGKSSYPSGEYSVVRVSPNRIELRDARARVLASLITTSVEAATTPAVPKLEFSTADGGHVLARIWLENDRIGYELSRQKSAPAYAQGHSPEPAETLAGSR